MLKLYKCDWPFDNSCFILFRESSNSPVMSMARIYKTSLSSLLSSFTTFGSVSLTGLISIITLISLEVVSIGNDFCFTTFSSLFRKKVNLCQYYNYLLAVFCDRYKNRPTLYNAKISSSMLCPFRSYIKLCRQVMILSGSMSLNLVNSHKYFQFLFFLSVTIKAVPEFSLIFS